MIEEFTCFQIFACPEEYTDCASAEVKTLPTSALDMTLNNLMVRFQEWWSFGECGLPLIAIAPRSILARSGSTW